MTKLADLNPNPRNPRKITDAKKEMLKKSLETFGDLSGIVYNRRTERLVGGHQRKGVLPQDSEVVIEHEYNEPTRTGTVREGYVMIEGEKFKYREVDWDDTREKAANIAANKHGGEFDIPMLSEWMVELKQADIDLELTGFDEAELKNLLVNTGASGGGDGESRAGNLSEKFLVPPFSILDARQGYWLKRKREWLAMGIQSEVGRGANALGFSESCAAAIGAPKELLFDKSQNRLNEIMGGKGFHTGTSVFDPVLCELAYRWFSPTGGIVLDPFAGGSVRGVVASKTGRQYVGVELREEQVRANQEQGDRICSDPHPVWVNGDSMNIDRLAESVEADLIFSCPPYADLEVYSDDPRDISNMPYEQFVANYREIIAKACSKLKNNRFAVWVIGEVRNKDGGGVYKNFVRDTIDAFEDAGLSYYNEAVLITSMGSLPIRAGKVFTASRKLGKGHQNVMVFVKGDPMEATRACGEVEVPDLSVYVDPEDQIE